MTTGACCASATIKCIPYAVPIPTWFSYGYYCYVQLSRIPTQVVTKVLDSTPRSSQGDLSQLRSRIYQSQAT